MGRPALPKFTTLHVNAPGAARDKLHIPLGNALGISYMAVMRNTSVHCTKVHSLSIAAMSVETAIL